METEVHAGRASYLSKQIEELTAESEKWGDKSVVDVEKKTKAVERARLLLQKDAALLEDVKARLEEERQLKAERLAAAAQAQEDALLADLDDERVGRAATRIQAFWRGAKARAQAGGKKKK